MSAIRNTRPESWIVVGCALLLGGLVAEAAWALLMQSPQGGRDLTVLVVPAIVATIIAAVAASGQRPSRFVVSAIFVSAATLVGYAAIPGGAVALAGAAWGMITSYSPSPADA